MPRFSILTPVFNGQAHIERMMQSIAAQTCKDFEHLILDGGSTDGTLAVAEKHKGANTKIISRKDKGPIDAINQAWRDTRGDFILVVCSDDWIEPEMIEKLSLLLEERPEAEVLCYGLSFWIEEGGRLRREGFVCDVDGANFDIPSAAYDTCVNHAFRRNLFMKHGNFRPEIWGPFGDREHLVRISLFAPPKAVCRDSLYNFQKHKGSLTGNGENKTYALSMSKGALMAQSLLQAPGLSSLQRRQLREWYAFCWVRAGYFLLRTGQIGKALALLLDGMIHHPTFCLQKILSPSMPEAYKIHHLSSSNGTEK